MAIKRHFTGKPLGEESSSESENEYSDTEFQETENGQDNKKSQRSTVVEASDPTESTQEEEQKEDASASGSDHGASGSSSDETDGDSKESESDSDDSSDGGLMNLAAPVFIRKGKDNKKKSASQEKDKRDNERALKTLEMYKAQDDELQRLQKDKELNLGGIDDTDGLDPEEELRLFQERKRLREERDRAKLEKLQDELDELELRRLRTEEELDEKYKEEEKQAAQKANNKEKVKGAFYLDEKLHNRKLEGDIEKYDKTLLPQRYDPKKK